MTPPSTKNPISSLKLSRGLRGASSTKPFKSRIHNGFCGTGDGGKNSPPRDLCEAVAVHSTFASKSSTHTEGCSGFMWIHDNQCWGLTHGSVLSPLLHLSTEEELSEIKKSVFNQNSSIGANKILEKLSLLVVREESPVFEARVAGVWKCQHLVNEIDDLLSVGWDFAEDENAENDLSKHILPMLVVFRPVGEPREGVEAAIATLLDIVHRGGISRGSFVWAVTSPFTGVTFTENKTADYGRKPSREEEKKFPKVEVSGLGGGPSGDTKGKGDEGPDGGSQYPHPFSAFLNSWSMGVVSGVSRRNEGALFLTDARATMGSEGGPFFAAENREEGEWKLAGMILKSICHWRGEWVGFSIACYLEPTLKRFLDSRAGIGFSSRSPGEEEEKNAAQPISSCPVVLVKCGYTRGTGIPINGDLGLILTCAHVVRRHRLGLSVVWVKDGKSILMKASVVYMSPPDVAYDVAVISVGPGTGLPSIPISKDLPCQGETVWSVGYAMSSGYSDELFLDPPFVSRGVVSSVAPGNDPPLLQTTCCIQAGSSGGAIIRETDGKLLAMIVCNTAMEHYDVESNKSHVVVYPSINFSIPLITLSPALDRYYKTEDPSHLEEFHSPSDRVQIMWRLKSPDPVKSKL